MQIRTWPRTRSSSRWWVVDGAEVGVAGFQGAEVAFDVGEVLVGGHHPGGVQVGGRDAPGSASCRHPSPRSCRRTTSVKVGDLVVTAGSAQYDAVLAKKVSCAYQLKPVRAATDSIGLWIKQLSKNEVAQLHPSRGQQAR